MNPPRAIGYFSILKDKADECLREEGLSLDFNGYDELINNYSNLKENEKDKAWQMALEINAWIEYVSNITTVLESIYMNSETEKLRIQSQTSIDYDSKNVSRGNRYANSCEEVVRQREKRNTLKALYDNLLLKKDFLEKAYYHCKMTYELGVKKETSYDNMKNSQDKTGWH
jgi:hypothetical protein